MVAWLQDCSKRNVPRLSGAVVDGRRVVLGWAWYNMAGKSVDTVPEFRHPVRVCCVCTRPCLHASACPCPSVHACMYRSRPLFVVFFLILFFYVYVHLFFRSSFHQTMYTQEPCNGIPDTQCNTLMLGGGGCMWGETVDTSDIMQTIWPRMGAIAERLWSPRELTSADAATERYKAFRCLLNRRGIAAAPALNSGARKSPPGPGSCYAQ